MNMLYLEWDILFATVRTLPVPLLEKIFPGFTALECPLLVLNAAYFRVLHFLHVELHEFHADGSNRAIAAQARNPGQHVCYARLKGWWEPSAVTCAILKTRWTIAGMPCPATA